MYILLAAIIYEKKIINIIAAIIIEEAIKIQKRLS